MRSHSCLFAMFSLACAASTSAHHSFAMFDQTKDVQLVGTVREFQWTNPHVWLQLDVADAAGVVSEWGIEGSTPSILGRKGWSRHSFKPGDAVTVTIHPMKNGGKGGSFVKALFADGHTLTEAPGVGGNSPQALVDKP